MIRHAIARWTSTSCRHWARLDRTQGGYTLCGEGCSRDLPAGHDNDSAIEYAETHLVPLCQPDANRRPMLRRWTYKQAGAAYPYTMGRAE